MFRAAAMNASQTSQTQCVQCQGHCQDESKKKGHCQEPIAQRRPDPAYLRTVKEKSKHCLNWPNCSSCNWRTKRSPTHAVRFRKIWPKFPSSDKSEGFSLWPHSSLLYSLILFLKDGKSLAAIEKWIETSANVVFWVEIGPKNHTTKGVLHHSRLTYLNQPN